MDSQSFYYGDAGRFVAQISAPRPRGNRHLYGAVGRKHTNFAKAEESNRADVARLEFIFAHGVHGRLHELVQRVGQFHPEAFRGENESFHVPLEMKYGRSAVRVVHADALKYSAK